MGSGWDPGGGGGLRWGSSGRGALGVRVVSGIPGGGGVSGEGLR